jgi:hypothetical protein
MIPVAQILMQIYDLLSVEDIMALADSVSMNLANSNFDQMLRVNIISICNSLKLFGQQLETVYKGTVNILGK